MKYRHCARPCPVTPVRIRFSASRDNRTLTSPPRTKQTTGRAQRRGPAGRDCAHATVNKSLGQRRARKFLSARQARTLIASVRPRDLAGKTRRWLAVELTGELEATGKKTRALDKELTELVTARGSTLSEVYGIGPSGTARQTEGPACYGARRAGGMPSMMAMRALRRRLSNVVFSRMLADR